VPVGRSTVDFFFLGPSEQSGAVPRGFVFADCVWCGWLACVVPGGMDRGGRVRAVPGGLESLRMNRPGFSGLAARNRRVSDTDWMDNYTVYVNQVTKVPGLGFLEERNPERRSGS
jgi:hypothetical protein